MGTIIAGAALATTLIGGTIGGIIAIDDRYISKPEFTILVGTVSELAATVKENRLESRLERLQDKRGSLIDKHGGSWCQAVPVRCHELLDRISATEDKLQKVKRK